MTRDEVREKVARAICIELGYEFVNLEEDCYWMTKAECLNAADAVIDTLLDAISEPSEGMVRAVDCESEDKYLARGRAVSAWDLMLKALKAELAQREG